jgi:hypothetical protein
VLLITHDRVLADAWCDEIADIRELSTNQGEEAVTGGPAPATARPTASSA